MSSNKASVNDAIIMASHNLSMTRNPAHASRVILISDSRSTAADSVGGDPKGRGQAVGRGKRLRAVLSWGIDNAPDKAEAFVFALIGSLRCKGGFRTGSPNFAGEEAILDVREAYHPQGYMLFTTESCMQVPWTICPVSNFRPRLKPMCTLRSAAAKTEPCLSAPARIFSKPQPPTSSPKITATI